MIHIHIGNSLCKLTGATNEQLTALRKECSYQEKTGRMVKTKTRQGIKWLPEILRYDLMDVKGNFPTGLLTRVTRLVKNKLWNHSILETRKRPIINQAGLDTLYRHKPYEPRPEQVEASIAALNHGRGIIVAPTGCGKSCIAALIADAFRVKTLIVTPGLTLKLQLTQDLQSLFGEDMVGELSDGRLISIENVQALDPNKKLVGVDCVIIDEFHHGAADTYRQLNIKAWTDVYFKIGLTATPFRGTKDERLLLESLLSDVIYRIEYKTAVEKGYIVGMEAYYIDMPVESKRKTFTNYHKAYRHFVVDNTKRNTMIADLAANLIAAGKSTIILTKQIDHGNILQDLLVERGHFVQFAEGKNELKADHIRAFCSLNETALIGTVGVLGEGVDSKPAEYIIIAGCGKSKIQFMQACGRGFRNFTYPDGKKVTCKIILVRDCNNNWMLDHFEECVKHLEEEYGVVPVRLDV